MVMKLSILYLLLRQLHASELELTLPFSELVKSPSYIDKTSFLPEIFNTTGGNLIITTPPGFGKTAVLSMIEKFAAIELNDDFSIKKFKQTESFEIFQNTTIARDEEFIQSHLSQYIVIKLNLKIDLPSNFTNDIIFDKISNLLYKQIEKYSTYLKNVMEKSNTPPPIEFAPEIKSIRRRNDPQEEREFTRDFLSRNTTSYDGKLMLSRIIKLLSSHFNRKAILLIDNYDYVAKGFLFKDVDLKIELFYQEINAMIYNVYDLHFSSDFLFKISITSTTAVPLEWVNAMKHKFFILNFTHYRFLNSHALLHLMGFTQTEVDRLMNQYNLKPEERQLLLTYFNPHLSYPDGEKIYCPKSVMIFIHLERKSIQSEEVLNLAYDGSFQRIGFLKEHLNNASRLELELLSVIANQSIEIRIDNLLHTGNILNKSLKRINEMMSTTPLAISKQTWSYLFETGFLINVDGNSSSSYKVSNHQAQRILHKLFIDHHDEARLPLNQLGKCSEQFVRHDVIYSKESLVSLFKLVENLLARCINNTASHLFDKDNEIKYQAIFYTASFQLAVNSTNFIVDPMQFRGKSGDLYYGVYLYNRSEKICAIVILKNSNKDEKEKEVLLNEAAATYTLPHGDVKHILYAVVNVYDDGHMETFSTTYERYEPPK